MSSAAALLLTAFSHSLLAQPFDLVSCSPTLSPRDPGFEPDVVLSIELHATELGPEANRLLDEVIVMAEDRQVSVQILPGGYIEGIPHASTSSEETFLRSLLARRADLVVDGLIARGAPHNEIQLSWDSSHRMWWCGYSDFEVILN